jgi:hypothetical protein
LCGPYTFYGEDSRKAWSLPSSNQNCSGIFRCNKRPILQVSVLAQVVAVMEGMEVLAVMVALAMCQRH